MGKARVLTLSQGLLPHNGSSPVHPFRDTRASMVRVARDGDRSHATNPYLAAECNYPIAPR